MSEREKTETGGSRKTAAEKGRGNNLCLFKRSAAIVAAASISAQKQKKDDDPTAVVAPLLLQPQPLLFPQQHIRQMIQRIQEQLFPPFPNKEVPQPLLQPQLLLHPHPVLHPESQPHPQSHPQLVAAKSLIDKSSSKFYLHFIIWQESVHSYKKVDSVYSLRYNKRNVTFL